MTHEEASKDRRTRSSAADRSEHQKQLKTNKQKGFGPMIILLLFSIAMLTLPLGTYFIIHHYLSMSTTLSAMGAVVAVQLIVAAYIYKAWQDESKEHQSLLKAKLK